MADTHDALKQEAARYGLTNLSEAHLAQLSKAKDTAARLLGSIPRDFPVAVEPAHTFRANKEA